MELYEKINSASEYASGLRVLLALAETWETSPPFRTTENWVMYEDEGFLKCSSGSDASEISGHLNDTFIDQLEKNIERMREKTYAEFGDYEVPQPQELISLDEVMRYMNAHHDDAHSGVDEAAIDLRAFPEKGLTTTEFSNKYGEKALKLLRP